MSGPAKAGLLIRAAAAAQVKVSDLGAPELGSAEVDHLAKVLRLRNGESVIAIDGDGAWCSTSWRDGQLEVTSPVVHEEDVAQELSVCFAPVKGDRPEWTVQKLTELGVDHIVVLNGADRAVVKWNADRAGKQLDRFRKIAHEASMQSRRVRIPTVDLTADLPSGIALAQPKGQPLSSDVISIAIGPEGGWSERELDGHQDHVDLGETILRAETAALAAGVRMVAMRHTSLR